MRRLVVVLALIGVPATAWAQTDVNRPPEGTQIRERAGMPDHVLIGTTFGLLSSDDGGTTWHWLCENAVGYGGAYDPDYVYTAAGTVIATTFEGVRRSTDGCTFEPTSLGPGFATSVALGSDGRVHVAMSFLGDSTANPPLPPDTKIYRSSDDGATFDAGTTVGTGGETWSSLEVAPSDPQRVYLSGHRIEMNGTRTYFLYRSDNGGTSYVTLPVGAFTTTMQSEVNVAAVNPENPDHALIRVTRSLGDSGNAFYRTINAGQNWTKVLEVDDVAKGIVFLAGGEVVIGTRTMGLYRSVNAGADFTAVPGTQPAVYCLHERAGGELWACTEPFAAAPFDGAIFSTTTLGSWSRVMRLQDIAGPAECAPGTIQHDCCVYEQPECTVANPSTWCRLVISLQITAMPVECALPDAGMTGGDGIGPPKKGCCSSGDDGSGGMWVLALVTVWGLGRRRRSARFRL